MKMAIFLNTANKKIAIPPNRVWVGIDEHGRFRLYTVGNDDDNWLLSFSYKTIEEVVDILNQAMSDDNTANIADAIIEGVNVLRSRQ